MFMFVLLKIKVETHKNNFIFKIQILVNKLSENENLVINNNIKKKFIYLDSL